MHQLTKLLVFFTLLPDPLAYLFVDENNLIRCVHEPVNLTMGISIHHSSIPRKRQAENFQPIRVHFSFLNENVGTIFQVLRLQRIIRRLQDFLRSAFSVIPVTTPLLFGRTCAFNRVVLPFRERYTCLLQCEPVSMCGSLRIPESDLQGCDQCDGNVSSCVQISPDGPGVANADMVVYYTLSNTGICGAGRALAYASACQIESTLDRPVAGSIVFCTQILGFASDEVFFRVSLHEVIHIMGFAHNLFGFYRDENGDPRTPRDEFGRVISGIQNNSTILFKAFSGWETRFGPVLNLAAVVVTPNVMKQASIQFGCSLDNMPGVELEDGGSAGTSFSHWDARIMGSELMTGLLRTPTPISRITLALLQDTGWYSVNYAVAEPLAYGSQAGCEYLHTSCLSHIIRQRQAGHSLRPFCDTLRGRSDSYLSCSLDRNHIAQCDLILHSNPLPLANQYFKFGSNFGPRDVDARRVGGMIDLANYCPYHQPILSNNCSDIDDQISEALNIEGEEYGSRSRCFVQGQEWRRTDIRSNITSSKIRGAGCYKYTCGSGSVAVNFLGAWFQCQCEGEELIINTTVGNYYYQGSLVCPSCSAMCYDSLHLCDGETSPCPGRTTVAVGIHHHDCENGGTYGVLQSRCECAAGFTGENCGVNIDDCQPIPCKNGGTCVDSAAKYSCLCTPGYTGENCTEDIDYCQSNPCENNGTCLDEHELNRFLCLCATGFTGEACSVDIDDCLSPPCENETICVDYTGENCSVPIDVECDDQSLNIDCVFDTCTANTCKNGGTCVNSMDEIFCECAGGYEGDDCTETVTAGEFSGVRPVMVQYMAGLCSLSAIIILLLT